MTFSSLRLRARYLVLALAVPPLLAYGQKSDEHDATVQRPQATADECHQDLTAPDTTPGHSDHEYETENGATHMTVVSNDSRRLFLTKLAIAFRCPKGSGARRSLPPLIRMLKASLKSPQAGLEHKEMAAFAADAEKLTPLLDLSSETTKLIAEQIDHYAAALKKAEKEGKKISSTDIVESLQKKVRELAAKTSMAHPELTDADKSLLRLMDRARSGDEAFARVLGLGPLDELYLTGLLRDSGAGTVRAAHDKIIGAYIPSPRATAYLEEAMAHDSTSHGEPSKLWNRPRAASGPPMKTLEEFKANYLLPALEGKQVGLFQSLPHFALESAKAREALRNELMTLLEETFGASDEDFPFIGKKGLTSRERFLFQSLVAEALMAIDAPKNGIVPHDVHSGPLAWDYFELLEIEGYLLHARAEDKVGDRLRDPSLVPDLEALATFAHKELGSGLPAQIRVALIESLPPQERRWLVMLARQAKTPAARAEVAHLLSKPSSESVFAAVRQNLKDPHFLLSVLDGALGAQKPPVSLSDSKILDGTLPPAQKARLRAWALSQLSGVELRTDDGLVKKFGDPLAVDGLILLLKHLDGKHTGLEPADLLRQLSVLRAGERFHPPEEIAGWIAEANPHQQSLFGWLKTKFTQPTKPPETTEESEAQSEQAAARAEAAMTLVTNESGAQAAPTLAERLAKVIHLPKTRAEGLRMLRQASREVGRPDLKTRAELARHFDDYVKERTGRSLTERFGANGEQMQGRAGETDRATLLRLLAEDTYGLFRGEFSSQGPIEAILEKLKEHDVDLSVYKTKADLFKPEVLKELAARGFGQEDFQLLDRLFDQLKAPRGVGTPQWRRTDALRHLALAQAATESNRWSSIPEVYLSERARELEGELRHLYEEIKKTSAPDKAVLTDVAKAHEQERELIEQRLFGVRLGYVRPTVMGADRDYSHDSPTYFRQFLAGMSYAELHEVEKRLEAETVDLRRRAAELEKIVHSASARGKAREWRDKAARSEKLLAEHLASVKEAKRAFESQGKGLAEELLKLPVERLPDPYAVMAGDFEEIAALSPEEFEKLKAYVAKVHKTDYPKASGLWNTIQNLNMTPGYREYVRSQREKENAAERERDRNSDRVKRIEAMAHELLKPQPKDSVQVTSKTFEHLERLSQAQLLNLRAYLQSQPAGDPKVRALKEAVREALLFPPHLLAVRRFLPRDLNPTAPVSLYRDLRGRPLSDLAREWSLAHQGRIVVAPGARDGGVPFALTSVKATPEERYFAARQNERLAREMWEALRQNTLSPDEIVHLFGGLYAEHNPGPTQSLAQIVREETNYRSWDTRDGAIPPPLFRRLLARTGIQNLIFEQMNRNANAARKAHEQLVAQYPTPPKSPREEMAQKLGPAGTPGRGAQPEDAGKSDLSKDEKKEGIDLDASLAFQAPGEISAETPVQARRAIATGARQKVDAELRELRGRDRVDMSREQFVLRYGAYYAARTGANLRAEFEARNQGDLSLAQGPNEGHAKHKRYMDDYVRPAEYQGVLKLLEADHEKFLALSHGADPREFAAAQARPKRPGDLLAGQAQAERNTRFSVDDFQRMMSRTILLEDPKERTREKTAQAERKAKEGPPQSESLLTSLHNLVYGRPPLPLEPDPEDADIEAYIQKRHQQTESGERPEVKLGKLHDFRGERLLMLRAHLRDGDSMAEPRFGMKGLDAGGRRRFLANLDETTKEILSHQFTGGSESPLKRYIQDVMKPGGDYLLSKRIGVPEEWSAKERLQRREEALTLLQLLEDKDPIALDWLRVDPNVPRRFELAKHALVHVIWCWDHPTEEKSAGPQEYASHESYGALLRAELDVRKKVPNAERALQSKTIELAMSSKYWPKSEPKALTAEERIRLSRLTSSERLHLLRIVNQSLSHGRYLPFESPLTLFKSPTVIQDITRDWDKDHFNYFYEGITALEKAGVPPPKWLPAGFIDLRWCLESNRFVLDSELREQEMRLKGKALEDWKHETEHRRREELRAWVLEAMKSIRGDAPAVTSKVETKPDGTTIVTSVLNILSGTLRSPTTEINIGGGGPIQRKQEFKHEDAARFLTEILQFDDTRAHSAEDLKATGPVGESLNLSPEQMFEALNSEMEQRAKMPDGSRRVVDSYLKWMRQYGKGVPVASRIGLYSVASENPELVKLLPALTDEIYRHRDPKDPEDRKAAKKLVEDLILNFSAKNLAELTQRWIPARAELAAMTAGTGGGESMEGARDALVASVAPRAKAPAAKPDEGRAALQARIAEQARARARAQAEAGLQAAAADGTSPDQLSRWVDTNAEAMMKDDLRRGADGQTAVVKGEESKVEDELRRQAGTELAGRLMREFLSGLDHGQLSPEEREKKIAEYQAQLAKDPRLAKVLTPEYGHVQDGKVRERLRAESPMVAVPEEVVAHASAIANLQHASSGVAGFREWARKQKPPIKTPPISIVIPGSEGRAKKKAQLEADFQNLQLQWSRRDSEIRRQIRDLMSERRLLETLLKEKEAKEKQYHEAHKNPKFLPEWLRPGVLLELGIEPVELAQLASEEERATGAPTYLRALMRHIDFKIKERQGALGKLQQMAGQDQLEKQFEMKEKIKTLEMEEQEALAKTIGTDEQRQNGTDPFSTQWGEYHGHYCDYLVETGKRTREECDSLKELTLAFSPQKKQEIEALLMHEKLLEEGREVMKKVALAGELDFSHGPEGAVREKWIKRATEQGLSHADAEREFHELARAAETEGKKNLAKAGELIAWFKSYGLVWQGNGFDFEAGKTQVKLFCFQEPSEIAKLRAEGWGDLAAQCPGGKFLSMADLKSHMDELTKVKGVPKDLWTGFEKELAEKYSEKLSVLFPFHGGTLVKAWEGDDQRLHYRFLPWTDVEKRAEALAASIHADLNEYFKHKEAVAWNANFWLPVSTEGKDKAHWAAMNAALERAGKKLRQMKTYGEVRFEDKDLETLSSGKSHPTAEEFAVDTENQVKHVLTTGLGEFRQEVLEDTLNRHRFWNDVIVVEAATGGLGKLAKVKDVAMAADRLGRVERAVAAEGRIAGRFMQGTRGLSPVSESYLGRYSLSPAIRGEASKPGFFGRLSEWTGLTPVKRAGTLGRIKQPFTGYRSGLMLHGMQKVTGDLAAGVKAWWDSSDGSPFLPGIPLGHTGWWMQENAEGKKKKVDGKEVPMTNWEVAVEKGESLPFHIDRNQNKVPDVLETGSVPWAMQRYKDFTPAAERGGLLFSLNHPLSTTVRLMGAPEAFTPMMGMGGTSMFLDIGYGENFDTAAMAALDNAMLLAPYDTIASLVAAKAAKRVGWVAKKDVWVPTVRMWNGIPIPVKTYVVRQGETYAAPISALVAQLANSATSGLQAWQTYNSNGHMENGKFVGGYDTPTGIHAESGLEAFAWGAGLSFWMDRWGAKSAYKEGKQTAVQMAMMGRPPKLIERPVQGWRSLLGQPRERLPNTPSRRTLPDGTVQEDLPDGSKRETRPDRTFGWSSWRHLKDRTAQMLGLPREGLTNAPEAGGLPPGKARLVLPDGTTREIPYSRNAILGDRMGHGDRLSIPEAIREFGPQEVEAALRDVQVKDVAREISEFHVLHPGEPLYNDSFLHGFGGRVLGVEDPALVELAINDYLANSRQPAWARGNRKAEEAAPYMKNFVGMTLNRSAREGKLSVEDFVRKMPSVMEPTSHTWQYVPPEKLDMTKDSSQAVALAAATSSGIKDAEAFGEWLQRRQVSHPETTKQWSTIFHDYKQEAAHFELALRAEGKEKAQHFVSAKDGDPNFIAATDMVQPWKFSHVAITRLDPANPNHQKLVALLDAKYFGGNDELGNMINDYRRNAPANNPSPTLMDLILAYRGGQ